MASYTCAKSIRTNNHKLLAENVNVKIIGINILNEQLGYSLLKLNGKYTMVRVVNMCNGGYFSTCYI